MKPTKGKFKVEIRTNCLICGGEIKDKRYRTFCSAQCRNKNNYLKHREYRAEYQLKKRNEKAAKPSKNKVQCLVCGKWYVQVGTHIVQRHKITARQYRKAFELPLKRGILPLWYRKVKGDIAIENKTSENLKNGKEFWYKKGDIRAIKKTGYSGQAKKINKLSQDIYPHK